MPLIIPSSTPAPPGSSGGAVFYDNSNGSFFRGNINPSPRPPSTFIELQQLTTALITRYDNVVTVPEKINWNTSNSIAPWLDRTGATITLTDRTYYASVNRGRVTMGLPIIDALPNPGDSPVNYCTVTSITASLITIATAANPGPGFAAFEGYVAWATPPGPFSFSDRRTTRKLIGTNTTAGPSMISFPQPWPAVPGQFQRVYISSFITALRPNLLSPQQLIVS